MKSYYHEMEESVGITRKDFNPTWSDIDDYKGLLHWCAVLRNFRLYTGQVICEVEDYVRQQMEYYAQRSIELRDLGKKPHHHFKEFVDLLSSETRVDEAFDLCTVNSELKAAQCGQCFRVVRVGDQTNNF